MLLLINLALLAVIAVLAHALRRGFEWLLDRTPEAGEAGRAEAGAPHPPGRRDRAA